jgi:hypothetical protein
MTATRKALVVLIAALALLAASASVVQAQADPGAVSSADANEGTVGSWAAETRITAGFSHTCVVLDSGKATDTLLVGDWNGDNIDTFAVQRKETP